MSNICDSLSDIQRSIVFDKKGRFVVRACPGSGKTYSVAARLARLIGAWDKKHQGIAAISFTNSAWREIERQITDHFNIQKPLLYPHFLGTIDSFVNNYIFLPFGHLVMGCGNRPVLVGEPYGTWRGKYEYDYDQYFDNISFDLNGELYAFDPGGFKFAKWSTTKHYDNLRKSKDKIIKKGYANQADADYYAMKILEQFPQVAKALTRRFPMLIIDESQDTSEIQMKVIEVLIVNGLNDIVLVGDPDQAIFEWNEAKPQLFLQKYEEWRVDSIKLNENRRSSQKICDCTCKLSSLEETSCAITEEVKDYTLSPMVVTYDSDNITATIESFISLCHENEIEVNREKVSVIYRSKDIYKLITGIAPISGDPWRTGDHHTNDFAKGKYLFDCKEIKKGFQLIERAYIKMIYGKSVCTPIDIEKRINEVGFIQHRKEVYKIFSLLPPTICSIGEWVTQTNDGLISIGIKSSLSINESMRDVTFDQIFRNENEALQHREYRLGTVHSVKGETFEAVLLFLKTYIKGKQKYKHLIDRGVSVRENEDLRIVYVGITRPRKLLVLAVPDDENKQAWESKLLS